MSEIQVLRNRYERDEKLSPGELALYFLWNEVDGFERLAEQAAVELAAYKKVAEAARQQCWVVETPEQLKFNSRLISAVDELDKVVGK